MFYATTIGFRSLCRLILFCFTFATFHPANLHVPWTLYFAQWTFDFGPTPAYGKAQDPLLASTQDAASRKAVKLNQSGPPAPMVRLPGHVLPALAKAKAVAPQSKAVADEPLTLTLVLKRDDQAEFERYLYEVYNPSSPNYRHFLTQSEIADRFGPSRVSYDGVLSHLQNNGFTLVEGSVNRLTLMVRGTRTKAERAFEVRIGDYELAERHFYANDRNPALPAQLAARVQAIAGLSNLAEPQATGRELTLTEKISLGCSVAVAVFGAVGLIAWWIAGIVAAVCSFLGAESLFPPGTFNIPYNFPPLPRFGLAAASAPAPSAAATVGLATGAGQTIGITSFSGFDLDDVRDWLAVMGTAPEQIDRLSRVSLNGGAPVGPDQVEPLLDIAAVMGTAPGAQIVVYDAPFTGPGTSFQALFNRMISDGVDIISNSWAYCEDQTTLADVQSIDLILQSAAAAGISVFSGSGDTGSMCLNGSPNTAHVPASSAYITAVGGTTLRFGPGFTYGSETWWNGNANTPPTGQGGFGQSRFFARPAYQDALSTQSMRSLPDVAVNADPASGYILCQASGGGCPDGKLHGGTSVAAPIWAAFTAVLNQAQGANLGFLNPLIYPLAGTQAFHGAASMGSDFAHVGLGSPNLDVLHRLLNGIDVGLPDAAVSKAIYTGSIIDGAQSLPVLSIPADDTSAGVIVVTLRATDGHTVSGKTIELVADSGNAVIAPAGAVTTDNNGQAVFTVTSLEPQIVTFTATDTSDGIVLDQTPSITFVTPPAAGASIAPPALTVTANGIDTATIAVTLKDALNRPTPGKLVTLSQGNGHSLITGPNPSVTDSNGQIQFTATNLVNEVVTYSAVDVTDGDLPVPGNTVVTFTNGSGGACGQNVAPPVGLNGYTVTPFATGFATGALFFGNINFGGCSGVAPLGFLDGSAYVPNFFNGDLFKLGLGGGVVSNANKLSTIGPTLGWVVTGKDGKLYATRTAVSQFPPNFTNGAVVELDPITGAEKRTLVSNLPCSQGLVVDPLSGDLFFDGQCFGAGSNNANLFRVRNPGSATPTLEVYATLPDSPNGQIAFSPKGTIYVVVNYLLPNPPVYRVSGTNVPGTPTVTQLPGVVSNYWLNVGNVDATGEATALVTLNVENNVGRLKLTAITTNPPTIIATMTEGIGGGTIGPDGCLYMPNANAVYKLTDPTGGCSFLPTNATPAITLTPTAVSPNPAQGTSQTFTATIRNINVPVDTTVFFGVTGANSKFQLVRTNGNGEAVFTYTAISPGKDTIVANATINNTELTSNKAQVTWVTGQHVTFITLNPSPTAGKPGQPVTVIASLTDSSVSPVAPIFGATVIFTLGGAQCIGTTDNNGLASCALLVPNVAGTSTLTATFAGSNQFVESTGSVGFNVVAAVPSCAPSLEVCDGQDNNCDGQIDEGLGTLTCGVGACTRTVDACVNGTPQTCTPGAPSPEVCDGQDNNCNGTVDEGNPGGGASCNTGIPGVCSAGTLTCTGGALVCQQTTQPSPEICNGVDDNCNGQIDEGLVCTPPPTAKCPHGAGYWKNHPAAWPVTVLRLGAQTYSKAELLSLLKKPSTGDASLILAHQLIATKLNIAAGVDPKPVSTTITSADQRLSAFSGKLPYKVKPSSAPGKGMVVDADKLEDFNRGKFTPNCKRKEDDDDDDGRK